MELLVTVSPRAQGYLVFVQNLSTDGLRQIATTLAKTRRPVVIFDEVGEVPIPSVITTHPLMRLFVQSVGSRDGRDVANYLLSRGHQTVGFFGAFRTKAWSYNRYRGMLEVYTKAGCPTA